MFTEDLLTRVETEVGRAEATTSVELIVVLSRLSGAYRDVDLTAGALAAAAALVFGLYGPLVVSPRGGAGSPPKSAAGPRFLALRGSRS